MRLRVFTELPPLLESIGSSRQVEEKQIRQLIAYLKQSLEDGDVEEFSWIEGKEIIADVLTKQGSRREEMDALMERNVFGQAQNKDNFVKYVNEEISIKNFTTKQTKGGDERR